MLLISKQTVRILEIISLVFFIIGCASSSHSISPQAKKTGEKTAFPSGMKGLEKGDHEAQSTPSNSEVPILQIDSGGHNALIGDIVFTPDGRYLVSASDDKLIRVWDLETGKTVRTLRGQIGAGYEGMIYAMALSPDGRWLATGGVIASTDKETDKEKATIRLYDFTSGKLVALLNGHTGTIISLAFSPDNRYLVSGSGDKTAIIWNLESKASALGGSKSKILDPKLLGHTDGIQAVAFTPDSQRVVTTGSYDYSLHLWRVWDGKLISISRSKTFIPNRYNLPHDIFDQLLDARMSA